MLKQNIKTISHGEHFHRECQVPIVIQAVNKTVILMSLLTSFWHFSHHFSCDAVLISFIITTSKITFPNVHTAHKDFSQEVLLRTTIMGSQD